ncbi:prolyl oligopeptidase family protein [Aphelenchoides avenae]|nr:prolyl oligopeptidase family protein [Aphelenchus avenae]
MCSIIFIAVLILTPLNADADGPTKPFTLKDVVSLNFLSPIESIDWLEDGRVVVKYDDQVQFLDVSTSPPTNKTIVDSEALFRYGKVQAISVSSTGKYIASAYAGSRKFPKPTYRIFNTDTSTFDNVGPKKTGEEAVKVIAWNPKGEDFAFVHENDIYYQPNPESESRRVTSDAATDFDILNGVADWLTMWWSKDGGLLAYLTIDNRNVPHADITFYSGRQYPGHAPQSYPKAGSLELPKVTMSIYRKSDGQLKKLNVTVEPNMRTYMFSASWVVLHGKQVLVVVWSNRYQNAVTISLCTFESGTCVPNFVQKYAFGDLRLWAEPEDFDVRYHTDDAYFVLLPHRRPNNDVYTQIARITVTPDLRTGRETFVPMGDYDVEKVNHYDASNNKIYFTAAAPKPSQRHLFATTASSTPGSPLVAECVACSISENCSYQDTTFSPDGAHFYMNCKGPGIPRVVLGSVENNFTTISSDESPLRPNTALQQAVKTYLFPQVLHENITLPNGFVSYVKLMLPHNLKQHATERRYPLLVDVYAGPGTQKATEEWLSSNVDIYFTSGRQYVIALIDGRGSGYRGWRNKQPLYGNLGTVEVEDQIETVKALLKRHNFLDKKRVGLWGWSYGGFVAARAIQMSGNSTFKCAASVAPVSNFKYYDATYTERYMGEASMDAYERTDLTRNVSVFQNVSLFLAHGTADDNVHFQNAAEFNRALTAGGIQYDFHMYTDDSHSLVSSRWHLYNALSRFFEKCFA